MELKMDTPKSVAQLIEQLKKLDSTLLVVVALQNDCEEDAGYNLPEAQPEEVEVEDIQEYAKGELREYLKAHPEITKVAVIN